MALEPSLANLATVLRDRSLWPKEFEWDYSGHIGCACGLGRSMWPGVQFNALLDRMSVKDFARIFMDIGVTVDLLSDDAMLQRKLVTPEQVADAIDAYLVGVKNVGEARSI